MISRIFIVVIIIFEFTNCFAQEQNDIARIVRQRGMDFNKDEQRTEVVREVKLAELRQKNATAAKAKTLGIPVLRKIGKRELRLIGFNGNKPRYEVDRMINAAISSNALPLQTSPYALDGAGWTVGVWEGGVALTTHQEFATPSGSRVTVMDGSTSISDHATHVTGIIASAGVDPNARGLANAVTINSYNSSSLTSELTDRSASSPSQQATKIYLSNHSYGIAGGWFGGEWRGTGDNQNSVDPDFGLYSRSCRSIDGIVASNPYHLLFWACGNERGGQPTTGSDVTIDGTETTYDPAIHPPRNDLYKDGYDTIPGRALAKNLVAVGCTTDAVNGNSRDPSSAQIADFSSWGPADDGRIKPDLVANGVSVYSSVDTSDSAYDSFQGTSMASPNTCGTATLLVQQYGQLFPGSAMQACTLKGLLIHTADDLGTAGPDYINGWGLVNGQKATNLLIDHHAHPLKTRLTENQLNNGNSSRTYSFEWDGVSEIRATLCWTDPEGSSESTNDERTPDLVNNLNLKIIAPDNSEYFPFVMPFVGDWSIASQSAPATTGVNNVDNVEQILIEAPAQTGTWLVEVSHSGPLDDDLQDYGLILSGTSGLAPTSIEIISPDTGEGIALDETYEITWASNFIDEITIDLLKGGLFHSTIIANEANDGSYLWSLDPSLLTGDDYSIRISRSSDPANFDLSNRTFSINPALSLEEALDTSGITWTTYGDSDWFQQSSITQDGVDAAQSGDIDDAEESSMEATLVGPGTLTFWWSVSCEEDYDFLSFYINGSRRAQITGEIGWAKRTYLLSAGANTVRWRFNKDGSISEGDDAGRVDQVVYIPDSSPDIAITQNGGSNLTDNGAPIDLGNITVGTSFAPTTFTISNTGTSDLTNLTLSVTGNHPGDVALGTLGATSLTTGTSTTFTATLTPGAVGSRNATIVVGSNAPDENPFEINLTFSGQSVYEAWSAGTFSNPFSNPNPEDNSDDDAFTNLQEFAFGMDPTDSDSISLTFTPGGDVTQPGPPTRTITYSSPGQISEMTAVFIRRKDHLAAGLTYEVEFSADLAIWTSSSTIPQRLTGANSAGNLEAIGVATPANVPLQVGGSAPPTYFRIGVSQN